MIPKELSKECLDKFQFAMRGKWHSSKSGNPWYYIQDLQPALELVAETAIRWAIDRQKQCDGKCGCHESD
jgi:hypothetical protein